MKHLLKACAAVVMTLSAACAIAAPANADANACQTLAKRLSQKSAEFVQINADGTAPSQTAKVQLVGFYNGVSKKDAALRAVADEVWTLRTAMASRNCRQADAFAY